MADTKNVKTHSISRDLTVGLMVTIFIISTVAISLNFFIASQRAKAELENKADEYVTFLAGTLETPLWNLTQETIEHIGEVYAHDELVKELRITDDWGDTYFDKQAKERVSLVSKTKDIFYQGSFVGRVEISLTSNFYQETNRQLLWSSIVIIFINLLSLFIITGFLLRRSLEKPLEQLGEIVDAYAAGQYDAVGQHTPFVEFQPLVAVLSEMGEKITQAQEQLVRREKLATLGQLAGGVAHELRNPLATIKNAAYFLDMALEEPHPEVKETLEILGQEVENSAKIITNLLDFARTRLPTRQKVDVNHIVREALSRAAVPDNVEVTTQLDKTLPPILADPDQLGQVFGNLILNAVQAMTLPNPTGTPKGGRLNIQSLVSYSKWVAVSFNDTGVGIPPENLDKLFEPLFTTKAKGIGLGLALVKSLVESHRGKVEVQSKLGKGSTFTVSLPIQDVNGG